MTTREVFVKFRGLMIDRVSVCTVILHDLQTQLLNGVVLRHEYELDCEFWKACRRIYSSLINEVDKELALLDDANISSPNV